MYVFELLVEDLVFYFFVSIGLQHRRLRLPLGLVRIFQTVNRGSYVHEKFVFIFIQSVMASVVLLC